MFGVRRDGVLRLNATTFSVYQKNSFDLEEKSSSKQQPGIPKQESKKKIMDKIDTVGSH
jgi:hypothetical protein